MSELPTVEEIAEPWDDDKLAIIVEGDGWIAGACSDVDNREETYNSPFPFVVHGEYTNREDISNEILEEFKGRVDEVYENFDDLTEALDWEITQGEGSQ